MWREGGGTGGDKPMSILVGVTGASGAVYGRRLVQTVVEAGYQCWLTASENGIAVSRHELGETPADWVRAPQARYFSADDHAAPFISGSSAPEACVIAPCSMATLGRVASGVSSNGIARAADVCLKERRRLVLVTRETPLSLIHIENMARATRAGAVVLPACPGFYHHPDSVDDMVDFVVGRVLDIINVPHRLTTRWGALREETAD